MPGGKTSIHEVGGPALLTRRIKKACCYVRRFTFACYSVGAGSSPVSSIPLQRTKTRRQPTPLPGYRQNSANIPGLHSPAFFCWRWCDAQHRPWLPLQTCCWRLLTAVPSWHPSVLSLCGCLSRQKRKRRASENHHGLRAQNVRLIVKQERARGTPRSRGAHVRSHLRSLHIRAVGGVAESSPRACRRQGQQRPRTEAGEGRSRDGVCTTLRCSRRT